MALLGAVPLMLIGAILLYTFDSSAYATVLGLAASQGMVIGWIVWWKRGRPDVVLLAGIWTGVTVTIGLVALAAVQISACGPYEDWCGLWILIPIIFGPASIGLGVLLGAILTRMYAILYGPET